MLFKWCSRSYNKFNTNGNEANGNHRSLFELDCLHTQRLFVAAQKSTRNSFFNGRPSR